jgi:hypothetical protein
MIEPHEQDCVFFRSSFNGHKLVPRLLVLLIALF